MAKAVEARWSLKDQVTPAIQKMNKETLKYKATVKNAQQSISKDWDHLKTGAFVAAAAVAAIGYGVVSFAKSAAAEASEGIAASTKLSAVLHNVKGVTDDQIQGLKDYASALRDKGVVDDDAQVAGIQQLGTFQLQAASIKALMPGMADLLAQQKGYNATGEDAVNIGNMMGKAMDGNVGALSRVGISFTAAQAKAIKFGTEQQKAATLSAVLQANVGGVNAALAKTDQGKVVQASNAFSGLKKEIGGVVLMIEGRFAAVFMAYLPKIQLVVHKVSEGIANWVKNGGVEGLVNGMKKVWSAISSVWGVASAVFSFFKNNWSTIKPIIIGVVGAIVLFKAAMVATNIITIAAAKARIIYTTALQVYSLATKAAAAVTLFMADSQKMLNLAMKASVIGLIVVSIVALVAVGVLLVKNWEQVKLAGMKTWNALVGAAQWAVNLYIDYANLYIKTFKFVWDSIKYGGISIWDAILSAAETGINKLLKLIAPVSGLLAKVGINIPTSVNFSAAKQAAVKPVWDNSAGFGHVDLGGAKFGQDSIMAQTSKAQAERDKNNAAHTKALKDNTDTQAALIATLKDNNKVTKDNTDGTNGLNGTMKNGVAVNMTPENIADSLVPRLERHLYGTA